MRLLFLGDVVGRAGRGTVIGVLPKLKIERKLDFVVINAENAADCNLWRLGADGPAQVPFALTPGSMFPLAVFAVRSCGLWLWLVRAKRFGHGGPI